jgi:t-SNARE complex subunit (syntaxin)
MTSKTLTEKFLDLRPIALAPIPDEILPPRINKHVPDFLVEVDQIKNLIMQASTQFSELIILQQRHIHSFFADDKSRVNVELQNRLVIRTLRDAKTKIKSLSDAPQKRMRVNIQMNLTNSVQMIIEKINKQWIDYQRELKKNNLIVTNALDADDEEIDIVDYDLGLTTKQKERADQMHLDIEQRTNQIRQIAQQVEELYQMFMDCHEMIMEQGEMLDTIEKNIENAEDDIVIGITDLKVVHKDVSKSMSKRLLCLLIGILVVGTIVIIVIIAKNR